MPLISQFLSIVAPFGVVTNLQRLLQLQRLILDPTINDSPVELFDQLGWLPIDDIIRVRKLFLLSKVSQGHCPEHVTSYFKHVRSTHDYRIRSAICNDVLTTSCKRNSGLKTSFQVHVVYGIIWITHAETLRPIQISGKCYRTIVSRKTRH